MQRLQTDANGESRDKRRAYVETYWESQTVSPYDYASCPNFKSNIVDNSTYGFDLTDVTVTSQDEMFQGADIINIGYAYADENSCLDKAVSCEPFICGLHYFANAPGGTERFEALQASVTAMQKKGAVVKLAFGGDEWGNTMFNTKTVTTVEKVVGDMIEAAILLGVDGIDLVQSEGVNTVNFEAGAESSVQLYLLDNLRARMPANMMLTYTFPGKEADFPFRDIAKYGHPYLDYINVHMATRKSMEKLIGIGVPRGKLSWGVPIGCNEEAIGDYKLEETIRTSKIARDEGYAGVMHWSVQRDTNRRATLHYEQACCPLQTGMPDETYLNNMAAVMLTPIPTDENAL